ncbi:hypothetical protein TYRP_009208 [Tyrophagus putrescentiae]|nr:hypothetical protein TYRP_009208 [Tyrophagus putrescentiae]
MDTSLLAKPVFLAVHNNNGTKPKESKGKPKGGHKFCDFCRIKGHTESQCYRKHPHLLEQGGQVSESVSLVTQVNLKVDKDQPWIVDTGASGHQTNQRTLLFDVRQPTADEMYSSGNSPADTVKAELIGTVRGKAWIGGKVTNITFENVKYASQARFNLFSVRSIPESISMSAKGDHIVFSTGEGHPFMEGHKNKTKFINLYSLNVQMEHSTFVAAPALAIVDNLPIQQEFSAHTSPPEVSEPYCSEREEKKNRMRAKQSRFRKLNSQNGSFTKSN